MTIQSKEVTMNKKDAWAFLCKEIARIKVTADAYSKLFEVIEAQEDSFNHAIQLVLDGWSRSLSTGLALFFDHRNDTWSLYRFKELDNSDLDNIKKVGAEIIELRMNNYAHLSKYIHHKNNFAILTGKGISIINNTILEIHKQLSIVSQKNDYNSQYVLDWVGISSSVDLLVEYLSKESDYDNTI